MYVFLQEDCSIEERHCNQSFRQSVLGLRSINFFLGVAKIHGNSVFKRFSRSFIQIKKRRGPIIDATCRYATIQRDRSRQMIVYVTPLHTVSQVRFKPFKDDLINAVFSKFFLRIISWSVVSKASFKSIKITPLRRPLLILTHQLSFVSNKVVRVLCSERKPDWSLFNKQFSFRQ